VEKEVRKPRTEKLDAVLGERLRGLRKERGLSQTALAERLGVTFQQVQKYENGTNRISALTLLKLATALDIEAASLLVDIGAEPQDSSADNEAEKLAANFARIRSPELRASVLRIVAGLAGR
jgi:transcriptional regulator with XRE-family HTH domain